MTPFTLFSLFSNKKKASPEIFFGNAHKLSKPILFIYIEFTPYSPCTLISHTSHTLSRSRASPYIHKQKNTRRRANSPRVFSIYSCMVHCHRVDYSIIVATFPDPTVLPPSRQRTCVPHHILGTFPYILQGIFTILLPVIFIYSDS